MDVDVEVGAAEERKNKKNEEKDGSSEVVRWEKLLPTKILRVLLVEADVSTRQIIAALLRKCSYRVVAAVPDGLMVWETLKDRPLNIDLILTEVELPSISGFALLTLIMEHDICKSIPVIMMSSQDSITTVLKCMLKGAADFLNKPVRTNELRNLWQHVWRRHMLDRGVVPLKLPATENKIEINAESESSQFSDYGSSTLKNKEESYSKNSRILDAIACVRKFSFQNDLVGFIKFHIETACCATSCSEKLHTCKICRVFQRGSVPVPILAIQAETIKEMLK